MLKHAEDKVKNLGAIFDSRLSFEYHINHCDLELNNNNNDLLEKDGSTKNCI